PESRGTAAGSIQPALIIAALWGGRREPCFGHPQDHVHVADRLTRIQGAIPPAPIEVRRGWPLANREGGAGTVGDIGQPNFRAVEEYTVVQRPIRVDGRAGHADIKGNLWIVRRRQRTRLGGADELRDQPTERAGRFV